MALAGMSSGRAVQPLLHNLKQLDTWSLEPISSSKIFFLTLIFYPTIILLIQMFSIHGKRLENVKTKLGQNLRIYYAGAHQGPRKHADEDYRI